MLRRSAHVLLWALFALGTIPSSTHAVFIQYVQQGQKLIGTGYFGTSPQQGTSVAASADGNTVIVGGPGNIDPFSSAQVGAVWIFTRAGDIWLQQGPKLVGSGAPGDAKQGTSVAISADGNTVLIGGPADNATTGAAWVFTRTNGVWSQQGLKLVGSGAVGLASQGTAVGLSADGNTAIIGGPNDASGTGAVWFFTRINGVWTQQGSKISISDIQSLGSAVAISGDASTAAASGQGFVSIFTNNGGPWNQQQRLSTPCCSPSPMSFSNSGNTALIGVFGNEIARVFIQSNSVWSLQTALKAIVSHPPPDGTSVSLSTDGNTALVGSYTEGATWAFGKLAGNWQTMGFKFVGSNAVGSAQQGISVALSGDGITAIVGGNADDSFIGAIWVFVKGITFTPDHDFNGDGKSDILWRSTNCFGESVWLMNSSQVLEDGGAFVSSEFSIVGHRDFDDDGQADILWRDTSGNTSIWFMSGIQTISAAAVGNIPTNWKVIGTADFNGDGKGDILWQDDAGNFAIWLMNGAAVLSSAGIGNVPPNLWTVVGLGDFNGDGNADILWRDTSGNTSIWFMNGTQVSSSAGVGNVATNWSVVGIGDFNADNKRDIVWRDSVGDTSIWLMNGALVSSAGGLGNVPTNWSILQTGDYNGDAMSDLLWQDTSGNLAIWFMNGTSVTSSSAVGQLATSWVVQPQ
jgi:FG-GAP-like repeat